jgi:steroid delta-isomerase-like uncharacterized protein
MPVAFILDFPDGALAQYDAVVDRMQLGGRLPAGALFHVAGPGPSGGIRVVDVWESDADFDAFADAQIGPLTAAAGLAPPEILRFEVAEVRESDHPRGAIGFFQVVPVDVDAAGFRALDAEVTGGPGEFPDGLVYHVNGPRPGGGWIVADAWTDRAARDRFIAERVIPAVERRGMTPPGIEDFDVHNTLVPRTAAAPMRAAILRALDEQDAAINRHDVRSVAAMYAEDAVLRDQSVDEPVRGRAAVEVFMRGYMDAFPDLRWDRVGVEIDGSVGVEQWRLSGTHEGDLPGLPATHRAVSIEGCSVLHFGEDGLVHAEENYWDEAAMLRQLGVMEPVVAS